LIELRREGAAREPEGEARFQILPARAWAEETDGGGC